MTDRLLTPDAIVDIARRLHRGDAIVTGTTDHGFVFADRATAYVGITVGDTEYVVARLTTGSETIGTHSPRLKTQRNKYVKGVLKHLSFDTPPQNTDRVAQAFEQADTIDTGYIHGYRVTPLDAVVEDVFKYHP